MCHGNTSYVDAAAVFSVLKAEFGSAAAAKMSVH